MPSRISIGRSIAILTAIAALARPGPGAAAWSPSGLSGGGAMFGPAISPVDPARMVLHCDMSGVYRSTNFGRDWMLIQPDQLQGNITCRPCFDPRDPQVLYSPSGWSDRLRVSRDGGRTWSDLGSLGGLPRGEIAVDPEDPMRLLVGVDEEVALSSDGGRTWRRCAGVRGPTVGFAFGRGAERRMFAATREGVYRSDDGGASWVEKSGGLPWRDVRGFSGGCRDGRMRLYCSVPCRVEDGRLRGGLYASADGGERWVSIMNPGLNLDTRAYDRWAHGDCVQYHQVLTTDTDPLRVVAFNANTAVAVPHHTAAYRSDDGGRTWRPTYYPDPRWPGYNAEPTRTTLGVGQYYQGIPTGVAICRERPDVLMQLTDGDCVITTNGGASWYSGDSALAAGSTAADGRRARFRNTGLVVTSTWNYQIDPFDAQRHYICYTDIGFARSRDAGATWSWWGGGDRAPWVNTCYELAFDPARSGRVWGAFSNVHDIPNDNIISGRHSTQGGGGICVSDDHADSWRVAGRGLPDAPAVSVVVDPASPVGRRTLYAALFGEGVARSEDDGRTWEVLRPGPGSERNRRAVRLQLLRDGTLYALVTARREGKTWDETGPGLYRSRDGGSTWMRVNSGQLLRWPKDFAVDPINPDRILLAAADAGDKSGGLYETRDGGASWRLLLRKGPQHFSAAFSPHHRGWIYATLCEGAPGPALWLSKDDGATWLPFPDLPHRNIQRVAFDPAHPDQIRLTTFGASVLCGPAEPAARAEH